LRPAPYAVVASACRFVLDATPSEDVDRRAAVLDSLAGTDRDLVHAASRTTVEDEEVLRIRDDLAALVARLRASHLPGPAGVRFNADRRSWNWGNAVVGAANGIEIGRAHV